MSNIINNAVNNVADFDSICMNMTQAFQALVSIAAKAETVDALLSIKEQLDSMSDSIDSSIDSYNDSTITIDDIDAALADVVSQTPIDSTNQIDTEIDTVTDSSNDNVDPRKPFDSSAVAYIKKQLTRINIITNNIAEGKDDVKRMSKETKLKFIKEAFDHYEMLVKFVTDSYKDSDLLETANFQAYVQSKQQILTTCYDNVAIGN